MGAFLVYILKSSLCLALFYLFYRLLLSKETFHRFNRIALLGILILSLLIPFCQVTIKQPMEIHDTVSNLEQFFLYYSIDNQPAKATFTWAWVLTLLYLSGILFFLSKNIYSLIRLTLLLKNCERRIMGRGITLIVHKKNIAPFSWMKYIVISYDDLDENGDKIILHELAHINKRHSIDLLLAEVCILFHWFNPAAWLLKQELQNIHEYEADDSVINQGIDAKQYQLLLIKKAVGTVRFNSLANSFNHSKLKKRITMMLKEKSNPWARLKYLYVLPLAAIAITAFARPEISDRLNEISEIKVSDLSSVLKENRENNEVDNLPEGSAKAMDTDRKDSIPTKQQVDKKEIKVIGYSSMVKSDTQEGLGEEPPLFIVNGQEVNKDVFAAISPTYIESISVYKDKDAIKKYGERGKNGVVVVTLIASEFKKSAISVSESKSDEDAFFTGKKEMNISISTVKSSGDNKEELSFFKVKSGESGNSEVNELDISGDMKDLLILIDGKVASDTEMNILDLKKVESVNVFKGDQTKKYGKKAEKGVIEITTRK